MATSKNTSSNDASSSLFQEHDTYFTLQGILVDLCAAAPEKTVIKAMDSLDMTCMRMMKGIGALAYGMSRIGEMPEDMLSDAQLTLAEISSLVGELANMQNTAQIAEMVKGGAE